MTKQTKRIPIHGSMTRPANPAEGLKELKAGRLKWDYDGGIVSFTSEEFKSNCPTTGQPDYYTVKVKYWPMDYYLESKTIKFYLWSFERAGFHCEKLAIKLATDISTALDGARVVVELEQKPRGGIGITTIISRP
jgi:7-cyano-7-deazaguanine reductase